VKMDTENYVQKTSKFGTISYELKFFWNGCYYLDNEYNT